MDSPFASHQRPEATRLRMTALACLALCVWSSVARAQAGDEDVMKLRRSPLLIEELRPEDRSQTPIFLYGDRLTGEAEGTTSLEGNAMLFHAIDSRQILSQDVLAVTIDGEHSPTIYTTAKPAR